jgi:hypothetical protein
MTDKTHEEICDEIKCNSGRRRRLSILLYILIIIGMTLSVSSSFLFCWCSLNRFNNHNHDTLTIIQEYAYFEGQREALSGDVRISNDGEKWHWKKSCWDSGMKPIFDPAISTNVDYFLK